MLLQRTVFLSFLVLFILAQLELFSQETRFFMPREIEAAYENGTRSYDGRPGSQYWQNTVDYKINVSVNPGDRSLSGLETVVFHNNSPDDLSRLIIRLYNDAFRQANARAYRVNPDDLHEGVAITRLIVAGDTLDLQNEEVLSRNGTNASLQLPAPVVSGESITLEIGWTTLIPETTIRMGAFDSTSYFVAYWYPQVAVYDDVFGWDQLSYDFSTEFYNNLGNYEVTINAPPNYTVLATGELQSPEGVLSEPLLARYRQAQQATEPVAIIGPEELAQGVRHRTGSWRYVAKEVTDFSFCLSDHFLWDAATQQVADRQVLIHTYYNDQLPEAATAVTANQRKMMQYFSEEMPGIPYPYPEFCTFISGAGGGGMETPMMANNGDAGLGVTVHEMFHTYFPMYVRTNEKRFAWMDEGWADFNTAYLVRRFFEQDDRPIFTSFAGQLENMGSTSDLPLITSTQFMDSSNYGYASYALPAFLYASLLQHLGEELFTRCYREYIRRWAYKSPTPYDFFYTFEDVSGQDLSWFWKPWFFEFGTVNVHIAEYRKGQLVVENKGNRPAPLTIAVDYEDGEQERLIYSPEIWTNTQRFKTKLPRHKQVAAISVNGDVPDEDLLDNFYPALRERYAAGDLEEGMNGTYALQEYPVDAYLSIEDGVLQLAIPAAGLQAILLPGPAGFRSIDGFLERVSFQKEAGQYTGIKIAIPQFGGLVLNGKKQ